MSGDSILRRIERLTEIYTPTQKCPTCFDWPNRICEIDEVSGRVMTENMPPDGCPACGRPVRSTIRIVAPDDDDDRESGIARYGTPGAL